MQPATIRSLFINLLTLISLMGTAGIAKGQAHRNHVARHNMFLFGDTQIFASHVVYKSPHNYQVILELNLPQDVLSALNSERRAHATDQFFFVLDALDLSALEASASMNGTIYRDSTDGSRLAVIEGISLQRSQYRILYFDELPLSLEGSHPSPTTRAQ